MKARRRRNKVRPLATGEFSIPGWIAKGAVPDPNLSWCVLGGMGDPKLRARVRVLDLLEGLQRGTGGKVGIGAVDV